MIDLHVFVHSLEDDEEKWRAKRERERETDTHRQSKKKKKKKKGKEIKEQYGLCVSMRICTYKSARAVLI